MHSDTDDDFVGSTIAKKENGTNPKLKEIKSSGMKNGKNSKKKIDKTANNSFRKDSASKDENILSSDDLFDLRKEDIYASRDDIVKDQFLERSGTSSPKNKDKPLVIKASPFKSILSVSIPSHTPSNETNKISTLLTPIENIPAFSLQEKYSQSTAENGQPNRIFPSADLSTHLSIFQMNNSLLEYSSPLHSSLTIDIPSVRKKQKLKRLSSSKQNPQKVSLEESIPEPKKPKNQSILSKSENECSSSNPSINLSIADIDNEDVYFSDDPLLEDTYKENLPNREDYISKKESPVKKRRPKKEKSPCKNMKLDEPYAQISDVKISSEVTFSPISVQVSVPISAPISVSSFTPPQMRSSNPLSMTKGLCIPRVGLSRTRAIPSLLKKT